MAFELDPRIAEATLPVGDLLISRVLLQNDSRFPWLILVPRRPGLTEILDFAAPERAILMEEIAATAQALRDVSSPHKLNVAALGNVVPQLHIHVVARFENDPAWPNPVFGHGERKPYEEAAAQAFAQAIARRLNLP